jgi:ribosomal protein S6
VETEIPQLDTKEVKTYEVGYLVSPLVPADQIEEFASKLLGAMMEVSGGVVVSQFTPKMRALAYPITQAVNNKNTTYKDAYLGAVKFQAEPVMIEKLEAVIAKNLQIIRHLLVSIPKGADRINVKKGLGRRVKTTREETKGEEAPKGPAMSSADIDKEIEGLIANTDI